MLDEQALVVECAGGLLVITGCAHPGVVNIVQTAREIGRGDVFALLGGFHLGGASDERIKQTVDALKDFGIRQVFPAHCTGEEATEYIKDAFGEGCVPCTGGATFSFD
jgi:7,8-dihydropterin-6-yl-methyl-4-(beta-D-ribofuranosyl)aminobenzene 5'-phosphate synthase